MHVAMVSNPHQQIEMQAHQPPGSLLGDRFSEALTTSALSVPMVQSSLSRNPIRHVRFDVTVGVDL